MIMLDRGRRVHDLPWDTTVRPPAPASSLKGAMRREPAETPHAVRPHPARSAPRSGFLEAMRRLCHLPMTRVPTAASRKTPHADHRREALLDGGWLVGAPRANAACSENIQPGGRAS